MLPKLNVCVSVVPGSHYNRLARVAVCLVMGAHGKQRCVSVSETQCANTVHTLNATLQNVIVLDEHCKLPGITTYPTYS
jgi:hypothetical protein